FYALRETKLPPVDSLRAAGVPIAVATDCNPGTSPLLSLRMAAGMACTLFRLTPDEALRGITVHAARALGLTDRGTLAGGQLADLAVWNVRDPAELCYWIGGNLLRQRWVGGRPAA
ncbi:MAG: imidazolonepropionase, partial [Lysobacterales bacterium 13-68-4]